MRRLSLFLVVMFSVINYASSKGVDGQVIELGTTAISDETGKYTYVSQRVVPNIVVFDNDKGEVIGIVRAPTEVKTPNNAVFIHFAKDENNKTLSNQLIVFVHYPDGYDNDKQIYLPPYSDIWFVSITDMSTNPITAKWSKVNSSSIVNNKMIGNIITDPIRSGGAIVKGRIFFPLGNYSSDTAKTMIVYEYKDFLK